MQTGDRTIVIREFASGRRDLAQGSLMACLGIGSLPQVVSIAGAGGKTTLMYALAGEAVRTGRTAVTTTTTRILPPTPQQSPCTILCRQDPGLFGLAQELDRHGHVTVARSMMEKEGKLEGITTETVAACAKVAQLVVVEADGAAGRPIKAPQEWEPVIPECSDLVIYVVGLECIGKPATDRWVFRLDRFLSVTGMNNGETIGPAAVGRLLSHPEGALKGVPLDVPVVAFLNKKDLLEDSRAIGDIANTVAALAGDRISMLVVGERLVGAATFS